MRVKEIMSTSPVTIDEGESLRDTASKMDDLDIGCLLVKRGEELRGIVTDRDIACHGIGQGLDADLTTIGDIMSKNVIWCRDNEDVEDAIRLMENKQIRRLPVMNDKKKLVGILTVGDISTQLPHELSGEVIEAISRSTDTPHEVMLS